MGGLRFNPRTPCGVRPGYVPRPMTKEEVSIHALLAECDFNFDVNELTQGQFQSTHSLRSATIREHQRHKRRGVSIHALLAECDFIDVP